MNVINAHTYIYKPLHGGYLSDPMMMFAFCISSMDTEVALQPQPRST